MTMPILEARDLSKLFPGPKNCLRRPALSPLSTEFRCR